MPAKKAAKKPAKKAKKAKAKAKGKKKAAKPAAKAPKKALKKTENDYEPINTWWEKPNANVGEKFKRNRLLIIF